MFKSIEESSLSKCSIGFANLQRILVELIVWIESIQPLIRAAGSRNEKESKEAKERFRVDAQRVKPKSNDFFFPFDLKQLNPDIKEKLIITKNQKPVLKSVFVALKRKQTHSCNEVKKTSAKPRETYEDSEQYTISSHRFVVVFGMQVKLCLSRSFTKTVLWMQNCKRCSTQHTERTYIGRWMHFFAHTLAFHCLKVCGLEARTRARAHKWINIASNYLFLLLWICNSERELQHLWGHIEWAGDLWFQRHRCIEMRYTYQTKFCILCWGLTAAHGIETEYERRNS